MNRPLYPGKILFCFNLKMVIVGASDMRNETWSGSINTFRYNIMHDKTKQGNVRYSPEQYVFVDVNLNAVLLYVYFIDILYALLTDRIEGMELPYQIRPSALRRKNVNIFYAQLTSHYRYLIACSSNPM